MTPSSGLLLENNSVIAQEVLHYGKQERKLGRVLTEAGHAKSIA